jgi:Sec-independent protein secretion pathway component TatC
LAIGVFYSLIAFFSAFKYLGRTSPRNYDPLKHASSPSLFGDIFTTVKLSFSGFSDGAAVFSLALPCAIFYNYVAAGNIRVTSRKDLILELWVLVYSLTICVWFYRVGACIRRVERAKERAMYHGQEGRQSRKRTLATAFVLSFSVVAFVALVIFLGVYHYQVGSPVSPFEFEQFWDDFCGYGAISRLDVIIGLSILAGYCAVRIIISGVIIPWVIDRHSKRFLGNGGNHPLNGKQRAQMFRRVRELHNIFKTEPRYRRWADILGVFDILAFMVGSAVMLWYYYKQREQLSKSIGARSFRDGWSLGQILAVSSLLPVLIGFVHTFGTLPPDNSASEWFMRVTNVLVQLGCANVDLEHSSSL